jgi:hypothetical protein
MHFLAHMPKLNAKAAEVTTTLPAETNSSETGMSAVANGVLVPAAENGATVRTDAARKNDAVATTTGVEKNGDDAKARNDELQRRHGATAAAPATAERSKANPAQVIGAADKMTAVAKEDQVGMDEHVKPASRKICESKIDPH